MESVSGIGHERLHGLRPARLRLGVGMQEKEPVAGRRGRAGRELPAAPSLSLQEDGTAVYGDERGFVDRAGVGDDDLVWQLDRSGEGFQRGPEHVCRVQRGDDDAQHRVCVPWSFIRPYMVRALFWKPILYAWVVCCCAGVTQCMVDLRLS
jgi:hypothetical protein